MTLLGERPLRQWGALVAMTFLGEDKPLELIRVSLARGRFRELVGPGMTAVRGDLDMFLLGLLSALDALLDRPMLQVLSELPMACELRDALLGTDGPLSKLPLLIQACERCDTRRLAMLASRMQLREDAVMDIHSQSLRWADEVLRP
jgi:EAL and modified HD-GYP domain-containing signal transduction protein